MAIHTHNDSLQFETASLTHKGNVRKFNEDSVYASGENGIWMVADGMGGHRDGNIASAMIAEAARAIRLPGTVEELAFLFRQSIQAVNERLLAISNGHDHLLVGSTIAALLIRQQGYACLWAGDSRCYLIRGGQIEQVSRDHTEVQDLVDRGVITKSEARTWPRRNVITRAVGADRELTLEQASGQVLPGDCFVLCSDGLTGHVEDQEILAAAQWSTAREACERLLAMALERGGKDNISVVVVNAALREATAVVGRW